MQLTDAGLTRTEPRERVRKGAMPAEWAACMCVVRGQRHNSCPVEDGLVGEALCMLPAAGGLPESSAPAVT